jgi:alpha-glucosidase (family GH31 glycosyl hydrolase)
MRLFPHVSPRRHSPAARKYSVHHTSYPFGLAVTRQGDQGGGEEVVFNSTPVTGRMNGLSFEEQFISFSTRLATRGGAESEAASNDGSVVHHDPFLYGLAEHNAPFRLPVGSRGKAGPAPAARSSSSSAAGGKHKNAESLQIYTLYARDRGGTPRHSAKGGDGLYGSHPFLMQVSPETGLASGMLLLNSNAMDVLLAQDTATFRTIGGIIDLYIFMGPTPADVLGQLTSMIGKPALPPYWALGFHLCRWGYGSAAATRKVVEDMRNAEIPQDVQWNDIDHMDSHKDFTLDSVNFAPEEMREFLDDLHLHGQRYVMIVDPGHYFFKHDI